MKNKIIIIIFSTILISSCSNNQKIEEIDYNQKTEVNSYIDKNSNKFNNATINESDDYIATEEINLVGSGEIATNISFSGTDSNSGSGN